MIEFITLVAAIIIATVVTCVYLIERISATRRRAAAEQRRREHVVTADRRRMESLGHLTRGIVHDFNHITAVVKGFANFIERDLGPLEGHPRHADLTESVEAIRAAAAEAESLCRQLSEFACENGAEAREVRVNDSLRTTRRLLHFSAVTVTWDLRLDDDATIMIDDGGLRQILLNLAFNARDAMPTGGELRIQTFEAGGHACVRVIDTGHGMSDEVCARIFDPFFTTKPKHQGTGLGLSMVYGIVTKADGRLRVNSDPGGTDVILTFPLVIPAACPSDRGRTSSAASPR